MEKTQLEEHCSSIQEAVVLNWEITILANRGDIEAESYDSAFLFLLKSRKLHSKRVCCKIKYKD